MTTRLPTVPSAVYCHALWRTGSTSIFNTFRADPRFMCFYEPLHEGLRTLTASKATQYDPADIQRMGHYGLAKPYFLEYCELVARRRGVPAFPAHLSYREFFDVSEAGQVDLKNYFDLLSDFARSRGKVPVFCLNRSWARIAAFRKMAPDAAHVFSLRAPQATWDSLRVRRSYFLAKLLYIFSEADPTTTQDAFPEIAELSLIERLRSNRTFKRKVAEISDARLAPLFWRAYSYALLNGVQYADFIVDLGNATPEQDDRIALGHYLAILPGTLSGETLIDRLRGLGRPQTECSQNTTNFFSSAQLECSGGHLESMKQDREALLAAACMAAPKLSTANRQVLSDVVSPRTIELRQCL